MSLYVNSMRHGPNLWHPGTSVTQTIHVHNTCCTTCSPHSQPWLRGWHLRSSNRRSARAPWLQGIRLLPSMIKETTRTDQASSSWSWHGRWLLRLKTKTHLRGGWALHHSHHSHTTFPSTATDSRSHGDVSESLGNRGTDRESTGVFR